MFAGFPGGTAGLGLLLLRATVGTSLMAHGALLVAARAEASWAMALGGVLVLDGLALVTGSLTPAAAVLGATIAGACLVAPSASLVGVAPGTAAALILVMAVAVGLLGPGAYSVDARLFGRREIEVPRSARGA